MPVVVLHLSSVICKVPQVNIIFDVIASVSLRYACLLYTHFSPCMCIVPCSSMWSCLHVCRCGVLASVFICALVVKKILVENFNRFYFILFKLSELLPLMRQLSLFQIE
jgi:hypothetical protein